MVRSLSKINHTVWGGSLVVFLLLFLTLGTLIAVVCRIESISGLTRSEWLAIRFTLYQSFVSAVISVVLAVPVSRAFSRRNFVGRKILITVLGAPFILPVIVAILGLVLVFGNSGLIKNIFNLLCEICVCSFSYIVRPFVTIDMAA